MSLSASEIPETDQNIGPKHVAIIMDGNGRWAQRRMLPRALGHKRGVEAVRQAIEGAIQSNVGYLTLYAFSSENWNRPQDEVKDLMGLLKLYLSKEINELDKEGVRLKVIGNRSRLSADINNSINAAEERTKSNSRLQLIIALSYGSRDEIVQATKAIAKKVESGEIAAADINDTLISNNLYTSAIPDPDLLIRTSGEQRLSNFLLWQCAYSEFYFTETLWPDFTSDEFCKAVTCFLERDRRYGARN